MPHKLNRKDKIKSLMDFYGYSKQEAKEMLEDMGE
jgi:hypothetical protein